MAGKVGKSYWNANLKILAVLLGIWGVVSFLLAIVFVDALDNIRFGGFKLGFWLAQQGAIYVYLLLILAYILLMDRLDRRHRLPDAGEAPPDSSAATGQGRQAP